MIRTDYKIITDTHLGHDILVKNGYRVEGFEFKILSNLEKLSENDILVHLGDLAFYNVNYWNMLLIHICKCKRKILVLGNHDRQTTSWYYDRGWSFVCNQFDLKAFGINFRFSHKPIDASEQMASSIDVNVHGHLHRGTHRKHEQEDFQHLVSIDDTLAPVSLRKIAEKHRERIQKG